MKVTINCDDIELNGTLTLNGDFKHNGSQTSSESITSLAGMFAPAFSGTGGGGGSMTIGTATITSATINGKAVDGHNHGGQVPAF